MIAPIRKVSTRHNSSSSHAKFLAMLPAIQEQARHAFRVARPELKAELIAEVVANAYCAFTRLVDHGKEDLAYPTPLAWFAIKQVRAGRHVGTKRNVRDVSSRYGQFVRGTSVERLDHYDEEEGEWREVLVEDRRAGPAETAAARIDVASWFQSLARKKRRIAQALAAGETTGGTARKYGLSEGRVSQLRQELKQSWDAFQGELAMA